MLSPPYCVQGQICRAELEKWSSQMYQEPEVMPEEVHMFDLDCFLSDISDTLFTMTQKPCPGANDGHNSEYHTTWSTLLTCGQVNNLSTYLV